MGWRDDDDNYSQESSWPVGKRASSGKLLEGFFNGVQAKAGIELYYRGLQDEYEPGRNDEKAWSKAQREVDKEVDRAYKSYRDNIDPNVSRGAVEQRFRESFENIIDQSYSEIAFEDLMYEMRETAKAQREMFEEYAKSSRTQRERTERAERKAADENKRQARKYIASKAWDILSRAGVRERDIGGYAHSSYGVSGGLAYYVDRDNGQYHYFNDDGSEAGIQGLLDAGMISSSDLSGE